MENNMALTFEEELDNIIFDAASRDYMPDLSSHNRRQRLLKRAVDAHQAEMDRVVKEVIGEEEDLNAPLNRDIDGNPESDKYPELYIVRRAVRNIQCDKQRARYKDIKEGK